MVEITGNTYPVRNQLKALGGKWSQARKCWLVPADKAEEARRLVPAGTPARQNRGPKQCKTCGTRINYGVYCGKCEYS